MAEKLTKKDLNQLFRRSNAVQSAFNFERMQGLGFCWGMIPIINKLYKNEEDRIAAYKRHMDYFNSHPWDAGIIYGIVANMEERKANGEDISGENIVAVKGALMGPLAGIGDSFFWGTLRPIVAGVCAGLALSGVSIAPLLFLIVMNAVHFGVQYWGVMNGYKFADDFMDKLSSTHFQNWMEAAVILGLFVVGGLTATWLGITTPLTYTVGEASVSLQSTLDAILPKMLPLLATLAVYAVLRKGKSSTWVMFAIIIVGFVLGFFGVLA
jgi:PTS system mannose-specific IID component